MALTIRKLSAAAERTIIEVKKNNEHINTNSKTIEFVLEDYLLKCNTLKALENKNFKLQRKLEKVEYKLKSIANAFGIISDMIKK